MANLPKASSVDSSGKGSCLLPPDLRSASVDQLIVLLRELEFREDALFLLDKKREQTADLAVLLWNSSNIIYILLTEILTIYGLLTSSKLTRGHSTRVCNALVLLQCVASHSETRMPFMDAKIPVYLYPFLHTTATEMAYEFLRLDSLAVIGGLLKDDDPQVVHFLLDTGIFPAILRSMEFGCIQSKSLATLIVLKILLQDGGLNYCCDSWDRCYSMVLVLGTMVTCVDFSKDPSKKLLNLVINCYLRLSEIPSACDVLKHYFPQRLQDPVFVSIINEEDPRTITYLWRLFSYLTTTQCST